MNSSRNDDEANGAPGASAQAEYEKRSVRELAKQAELVADDAAWRRSVKEKRPVLGRIATTLTPKPRVSPESSATRAWRTGAEGERIVAAALAGAVGVEVLHDRRVPGSRANIDHVVVASAGVFVVDAKKYTGRIEIRDKGGLLRADMRLYVNGRDRSTLADGVLRQVDVVRAALGPAFSDTDVRGVLCFVDGDWGLLRRAKSLRGVTVIWPEALAKRVSEADGSADRVSETARHLRTTLRPA